MNIRPFREIKRRKTKIVSVGDVKIGGDNPISVQSMTNTLTTDVKATIKQINEIQSEGADLVRVSCPDENSTKALKEIVKYPIISDPSHASFWAGHRPQPYQDDEGRQAQHRGCG